MSMPKMTLRLSSAIVAFGLVSCAEVSRPSRSAPQTAADSPEPSVTLPDGGSGGGAQGTDDPSQVATAEEDRAENPVDETLDLSGYAVHAGLALAPTVHGASGRLELLEDKRFTPALRDYIAGRGDCNERPREHPEFCESVDSEPLRPAVVRMSDPTGHDVAIRRLQGERASLETTYLYGTRKPTYLVTVDLRTGAGGWAPVCTYLAEVEHGTLQWLSGVVVADGRRFEITLCESHHAMWRIVPSGGRRAKDLIFVEGEVDETLVLGRYAWDGTGWRLAVSRSVGNWDSDRAFPDAEQFPPAEPPTR